MPKGDFAKTKDFIIPLRGVVRDGKLAALLDHTGAEIGMPVTANESVTGGIEIIGPAGAAVSRKIDFGGLVEPWVIAHRGAGANLAPDSVIGAYDYGTTLGTGIIDGGDWRATADGVVFDWHDLTLDRISDQTGNYADATSGQIARIKIDASSFFGGGWQDSYGAPGPLAYFSRYKDVCCLAPEPAVAAAVPVLINTIKRLAMERQCLINGFTDAALTPFVAAGFPYVLRNFTNGEAAALTTTRCDQLVALGIKYVGFSQAAAVDKVQIAIAAGLKVMITTPTRHSQADKWAGMSIAGYASDDPVYFSAHLSGNYVKYRRLTDPFASGAYYHGHIDGADTFTPGFRGSFQTGGKWRKAAATTVPNWVLQGWACPIAKKAETYSIDLDATIVGLATDKSRWFSFAICCPDDAKYDDTGSTSNGYQIWIRPSAASNGSTAGDVNIAVKNAGVGGTPQTGNLSAALVVGNSIHIKIDVTPTSITVTISGAVTGSVKITDATHRGGYWHIGHAGAAAGLSVDYSSVVIS